MIASVTRPFCGDCTRARLSAEGPLYTCLFAVAGTDLKGPLRSGARTTRVAALIRASGARARPLLGLRSEADERPAQGGDVRPRGGCRGAPTSPSDRLIHRSSTAVGQVVERGRAAPAPQFVDNRVGRRRRARNVVLARRGPRKTGAAAIASKSSTRSAAITSRRTGHRTRDHIKGRRSGRQLGRFVPAEGRPQGWRLGARRDVIGIPVSVLPPGVEAAGPATAARPVGRGVVRRGCPTILPMSTDASTRARPIPPAEQPERVAALVAAVRARTDSSRASGSCSGRGSAASPTTSRTRSRSRSRTCPAGRRRRRPGHVGRLLLGRSTATPVVVLQGRFHLYEGNDPGLVVQPVLLFKALGARSRGPDQRRRRREPGLRPGHADGHQRPPQPHRPDPAPRAQRGRARAAVPRPDRRLDAGPAGAPPRGRGGPRASSSRRASTSACSARPTRPRPRSGCSAASGPTRSGCRRCSRRSRRAGRARGLRGLARHERRRRLHRPAAQPRGGARGRRAAGPAPRARHPPLRRGPAAASAAAGRGRRPPPLSPSSAAFFAARSSSQPSRNTPRKMPKNSTMGG